MQKIFLNTIYILPILYFVHLLVARITGKSSLNQVHEIV